MSEERDFEAEASKDGWSPIENWKGDPDKWKDAQTFIEDGERIAGIAVKKAKAIEEKLETLQGRLEEVESTKVAFAKMQREATDKARQERDAALAQLEELQVKAIDEGDGSTYMALETRKKELAATAQPKPGEEPWAVEWAERNTWYANDPVLRQIANGIGDQMREEGFADTGGAFLDELARRTKEYVPDRFENPRRKESVTGADGKETEGSTTESETFANLPADAKAACNRYVSEGLMTKEEYVKDFYSM